MNHLHLKNRGLSTVVTTLIILVVSVLLAGVVTMYATNITSTRTQAESLKVTNQHIWVYDNGNAILGVVIDNVGGRDVVISGIQVRGVVSPWTDVYFDKVSSAVSGNLNLNSTALIDQVSFVYVTGTPAGTFTQGTANQPLTLVSGSTIVIYIASPDNISQNDIGGTVGITTFTQNAQYYVECNVKAAA